MRSVLSPEKGRTSGLDELERLRAEYADRRRRLAGSDIYSLFNPGNLFMVQQRHRMVIKVLREQGITDLTDKRILEVGCGNGGVLHEFTGLGASPRLLHGTDLLPDRLEAAQEKVPGVPLLCSDGQYLPYKSEVFDLVLQFTVFSSVLAAGVKRNMAREMVRVVRPGGLILWYDFWLNPTNPHTRGVRPAEIRELFPGCRYSFRRVTLAPPITRRLAGRAWLLCTLLESLRVANSHYLAAIRPIHGEAGR